VVALAGGGAGGGPGGFSVPMWARLNDLVAKSIVRSFHLSQPLPEDEIGAWSFDH